MIIVISNRNVNPEYTNEYLFGELSNEQGADQIRIAKADYKLDTNQWILELIPENNDLDTTNLPSQQLFEEIAIGIRNGTYKRNWVFYIPGFNQSSRSSLDVSWQITQKYDVNVVLFSWPSNPGGFIANEYKRAIQAAKMSVNGLKRAFEKLDKYIKNCPLSDTERKKISFNLLIHSLGNFIVENCARLPLFDEITEIFQNIIFHQADVDNKNHREWIDSIEFGKRLYVTINKNDYVLTGSGAFHLDRLNANNVNNRLGNTTKGLNAQKPIYIDFTQGGFVATAHNLFLDVNNPIIVNFFQQVFKGRQGEVNNRLFRFDSNINAYVFAQNTINT
jgi:esterase/lipase superfamily enzyme